ncbi:MAG TPA: NADH-quinone oxidoreductase subunit NuoF [Candidatus Dormibacteraeota bacterium]|nr:NADH-quinone oxidoreductase subunit NuoF [Candidatus Dormibacteraeota bacterium]
MSDPGLVLTRHRDAPDQTTLAGYERVGGYGSLRRAVQMGPDGVAAQLKASGLRGRGGAAFPTATKWSFLPKDIFPRYLCVNADESEPGCFKDRVLMEEYPHQLLEGVLISAFALRVTHAFIYIRGEYRSQRELLERAVEEVYRAGYAGGDLLGSGWGCELIVHGGAGAYICGEETALLESLEGRRGQPRLKPPFPAVKGLYGQPTVVNNVETLSNLPFIVGQGGSAYAAIGTEASPGTRLFCVSGHVERPGTFEVPLGRTTFRDLVALAGGVWKGRKFKAMQPGGGSMQILGPEHLDTPLDFKAVADAGSSLGAGALVVMDESTCVVNVAMRLVDFYRHESCGKCVPCREGTYFESELMHRLEAGLATRSELATLSDVCANMDGRCFCPLGDTATWFVMSAYRMFPEEFESHCDAGGCPVLARQEVAV